MIKIIRELSNVYNKADLKTFLYYLKALIMNLYSIIRTKSLFPADKAMTGRECSFRINEKDIILEGNLFGLAREIYCRETYFTIEGFRIDPDDTVIDLGANAGVFTVLAALCSKQVISVEAQSGFRQDIESNLNKNKCRDKVSIITGLVGAGSGYFSEQENIESSSHFTGEKSPEISVIDLIKQFNIDKIDFLKIDIEGAEFDLFNSNVEWLQLVNKIAMEVHPEYGNMNSIARTLKKSGFDVTLVDKNQHIVDNLNSMGFIFAKRIN